LTFNGVVVDDNDDDVGVALLLLDFYLESSANRIFN